MVGIFVRRGLHGLKIGWPFPLQKNIFQHQLQSIIILISLFRIASRFAVAQVTAITAGYASYPMDTIRRRLMMQSEKPVEEHKYKGAFHCGATIMKEEGTTAFFKGAGANALRTVGSAMVLVLYDTIKDAMEI